MFKIRRRAEKTPVSTKLIVGLGNPGSEYEGTFHNVGFAFVDYLADQWRRGVKTYRDFSFLRSDGLIVVKPLDFMNSSGGPVKKALKYFDMKTENLIIVHDDSDLKFGQYKISFGRGSAGHKGVESIFKALGTDKFERVRIGIRRPQEINKKNRRKAGDFVLKKMTKSEQAVLGRIFLKIVANYLKG
ncbi:MAG: aminoacyl-tRNA hydrolase [Candidatus Colwellbacteria bacterium]|nr:aminoacyl-tRNA hydrolase [Candidatus Colwellbacteria bacterium]